MRRQVRTQNFHAPRIRDVFGASPASLNVELVLDCFADLGKVFQVLIHLGRKVESRTVPAQFLEGHRPFEVEILDEL